MLYERIEKLLKAKGYTPYSLYKNHNIATHTIERIKNTGDISKPVYLKLKQILEATDIDILGESEDAFDFLPVGHSTKGSVRKVLDAQRKSRHPFRPDTLTNDRKDLAFPVPTGHPPMPERRPNETFEEYYWRIRSGV